MRGNYNGREGIGIDLIGTPTRGFTDSEKVLLGSTTETARTSCLVPSAHIEKIDTH